MIPEATTRYEASDFVGESDYAVEVIRALQAELARLTSLYEDRGDFVIYRHEYESLLADREELARLRRVTR